MIGIIHGTHTDTMNRSQRHCPFHRKMVDQFTGTIVPVIPLHPAERRQKPEFRVRIQLSVFQLLKPLREIMNVMMPNAALRGADINVRHNPGIIGRHPLKEQGLHNEMVKISKCDKWHRKQLSFIKLSKFAKLLRLQPYYNGISFLYRCSTEIQAMDQHY